MTEEIRIGFSMHPRWARAEQLEPFLVPLRNSGLASFEFELDDHQEDWPAFEPLMEASFQAGLGLSFHAPYRFPYHLGGFAFQERGHIQDSYRPMLTIAETWAQKSQICHTLVVHAAVAHESANREVLADDTLEFLTWVLEEFPHLQIALENNHPARAGDLKLGVEPADVLALISAVNDPRLGACWDLGHDFLRHDTQGPAQDWLAKVRHVHVHDVDETGEDHFPLIFGRVPYWQWLRAWKAAAGGGGVVLELKGNHLQNWLPEQIQAALQTSLLSLNKVLA